jgi:hypothetical protein
VPSAGQRCNLTGLTEKIGEKVKLVKWLTKEKKWAHDRNKKKMLSRRILTGLVILS